MLSDYYRLTKPGIIRGNALTAAAGFFLASRGNVDIFLFVLMITGISLVVASASVFNNYIDRDIDKLMSRTKNRALASGQIAGHHALMFATALGVTGLAILLLATNILTAAIALFGFIMYVVVYGVAKRKSIYGTQVGSVSGSIPPVVGYTAVTNQLDITAFLLFTILTFWQMPHFYAIALYRAKDYASAAIPVLPLVKGERSTKIETFAYIILFAIACGMLTYFSNVSYTFAIVMTVLSGIWIWIGIRKRNISDATSWGWSMFRFSLVVILVFCILLYVDVFLS